MSMVGLGGGGCSVMMLSLMYVLHGSPFLMPCAQQPHSA